jgi:hypothetical protein
MAKNPKNYLSIFFKKKSKTFWHVLKIFHGFHGFYNKFVKFKRILANISITLKILIIEN